MRIGIGCLIFSTFLAFFHTAFCAERSPWFGVELEIDANAWTQLQAYRHVSSGGKIKQKSACDLFFGASAGTVYRGFAADLEIVGVDSAYQTFGMDSIQATGRYQWSNDIVADAASIVTGLSISQVFKPGLRNLSSFHHGGLECEAHVAIGKEFSRGHFWIWRCWGIAGLGMADIGYPWLRANINWERNFRDMHRLRCFVNTLWGLGPNMLDVNRPFHGYGTIRHQSVDLGLCYSSFFTWGGTISLEYAYRIFARNCPQGVNQLLISIWYPFGL